MTKELLGPRAGEFFTPALAGRSPLKSLISLQLSAKMTFGHPIACLSLVSLFFRASFLVCKYVK